MYSHFHSAQWLLPAALIFVAAVMMTWSFARHNALRCEIAPQHIDRLVILALLAAIGGCALVLLLASPANLPQGRVLRSIYALRILALLAAGVFVLSLYAWRTPLPFRRLLDVFALPALVGLMMHRIGCFLAGCCWGDMTSDFSVGSVASQVQTLPAVNRLLGGVFYAPGSPAFRQHVELGLVDPAASTSLAVVPVQLYESALLLLLVLALQRFPWHRFAAGSITLLVTCHYALLRFFLEYLRADAAPVLGNLTAVQLQCLPLIFSAALLPVFLQQARRSTEAA